MVQGLGFRVFAGFSGVQTAECLSAQKNRHLCTALLVGLHELLAGSRWGFETNL